MGEQRLRAAERLRRSSDFQQAFQHGRKLVTSLFVVYVVRNSLAHSRCGLAVSKRVGQAVVRNLLKRRLRELFRQHKFVLDPPVDMVIVVRREAAQASGQMFAQQFVSVLQRCQSRRPPAVVTEFSAGNEERS